MEGPGSATKKIMQPVLSTQRKRNPFAQKQQKYEQWIAEKTVYSFALYYQEGRVSVVGIKLINCSLFFNFFFLL